MSLVLPIILATEIVQQRRQNCRSVRVRAILPERIRRKKRGPEHHTSMMTNTVRAMRPAWRHKAIRSRTTNPVFEFGYKAEGCDQPAQRIPVRLSVLCEIPYE